MLYGLLYDLLSEKSKQWDAVNDVHGGVLWALIRRNSVSLAGWAADCLRRYVGFVAAAAAAELRGRRRSQPIGACAEDSLRGDWPDAAIQGHLVVRAL